MEEGFKERAAQMNVEIESLKGEMKNDDESKRSTLGMVVDGVGIAASLFLPGIIPKAAGIAVSYLSRFLDRKKQLYTVVHTIPNIYFQLINQANLKLIKKSQIFKPRVKSEQNVHKLLSNSNNSKVVISITTEFKLYVVVNEDMD